MYKGLLLSLNRCAGGVDVVVVCTTYDVIGRLDSDHGLLDGITSARETGADFIKHTSWRQLDEVSIGDHKLE